MSTAEVEKDRNDYDPRGGGGSSVRDQDARVIFACVS
jgi:hypothetical protein